MRFTDPVAPSSTRPGAASVHTSSQVGARATRRTARRPASPARLLTPARRTVPFVGRTAELASCLAWCDDGRPVGVRLVAGPRGVGASRFAREVAHRMARAGWTCLDVPDGAERAALAAVPDGAPALLVVDDAATRGAALADLLRTAARGRNGTLRVLLVAQGAGVWFERLAAADPAVRTLLEPARSAPPLTAAVLPRQVDARLVAAFAEPYARALGLPVPEVAVASVPGGGARMLDLQVAALCAVLRARRDRLEGAVPVDVADAMDELLEHERWSWFRSAESAGVLGGDGFPPEAMDALVAAATLTGVRTPEAAEELVRRVGGVVPGVHPDRAADVGRWLLALDPARSLPARLADPHLLAELTDTPGLVAACLDGAGTAPLRRAALRLTGIVADRLSGEILDGRDDHGPALERLGAAVAALPDDHDTLRTVLGALPAPSLALGELRAELAVRTLATVPRPSSSSSDGPVSGPASGPVSGPVTDPVAAARLAAAAYEAGVALREIGRPADAERQQRRAVDVLRRLAAGERCTAAQHRPALAAALSALGVACADQGRAADGLAHAQEAVALLRRDAARPGGPAGEVPGLVPDLLPDLAHALAELATVHVARGDTAAALAADREAAELWRRMEARTPGTCPAGLARSLAGIARHLLVRGRAAEAAEPATESLALRRRLAGAEPDAFLGELADALEVAGRVHAARGDARAAAAHVEEAVEVLRIVAEENPGRYLPDLARMLQALGVARTGQGRGPEGVTLLREAVEVQRRLVADEPGRYAAALAGALSAVGTAYARLDRPLAALDAEREATRTWRELAVADPATYLPRLARSLTTVSAGFASLRLGEEAVAPAQEAVEVLRELLSREDGAAGDEEDDDDAHRRLLAEALHTLALVLHDQERFEQAQAARAEAEDVLAACRQGPTGLKYLDFTSSLQ